MKFFRDCVTNFSLQKVLYLPHFFLFLFFFWTETDVNHKKYLDGEKKKEKKSLILMRKKFIIFYRFFFSHKLIDFTKFSGRPIIKF